MENIEQFTLRERKAELILIWVELVQIQGLISQLRSKM